MAGNLQKWSETFNFFWYNDDEIFRFTQEDFDRKAKAMADGGVTIVITFSCTHFRWSMRPHWGLINACLAKLVKACHKYGIRVVEHHSTHLTFDPRTGDEWDYMRRILTVRHSSIDSWPGLREYVTTDPEINGKPLSSVRQIDGRTGQWARSPYRSFCMCFNNPDYRAEYFRYLETVYQTGIDGLMTDDVQYYGETNACACPHCRTKFKADTGYDLPQPEDWDAFFGNYDDPVFIAWKQFKYSSTKAFQYDVNAHFEGLGYHLLRPNYISQELAENWSAYPFDNCIGLWDFVFQENCFSALIGPSFLTFAVEALHRFAMGRQGGAPSMSMFYPNRQDSAYLSWALSRSWGQMYLGTFEGMDLSGIEKPYRAFEKAHAEVYDDPKKRGDITFFFSRQNRDLTAKNKLYHGILETWMQAAYVSGLQCDLVFEDATPEELQAHPCLCLASVGMLAEEELQRLCGYLQAGGRMIAIGDVGLVRPDGSKRAPGQALNALKASAGAGALLVIADPGAPCFHVPANADRWQDTPPRVQVPASKAPQLRGGPGRVLAEFIGTGNLTLAAEGQELYGALFARQDGGGYSVQIFNAAGLLPAAPATIGHEDTFPHYTAGHTPLPVDTAVRLRNTDGIAVSAVTLHTPERADAVQVPFTAQGGAIRFTVPAGFFSGYMLAKIS